MILWVVKSHLFEVYYKQINQSVSIFFTAIIYEYNKHLYCHQTVSISSSQTSMGQHVHSSKEVTTQQKNLSQIRHSITWRDTFVKVHFVSTDIIVWHWIHLGEIIQMHIEYHPSVNIRYITMPWHHQHDSWTQPSVRSLYNNRHMWIHLCVVNCNPAAIRVSPFCSDNSLTAKSS